MTVATVIMAAGQGTRMRSSRPKVLHRLGGTPMLAHAVAVAQDVGDLKPVVIVGHGADEVQAEISVEVEYVMQARQLGTGHAVLQAEPTLRGRADHVLVWAADMPLVTAAALRVLVDLQRKNEGPFSLLTVRSERSRGFGRIVRDDAGALRAIVEEAQATEEELAIGELNPGFYCFEAGWLWDTLPALPLSPKGEYYLTDLVALAAAAGRRIGTAEIADPVEAVGINTRVHLAEAETLLRERINRRWMEAGVTIVDPQATYIGAEATIGRDTVVLPNTHIEGRSTIGVDCVIGPNSIVRDTSIGDRCEVACSVLEQAVLEDDVDIGPFGHLRRGAHLARGVHMGNFGEVKNARLGPGVKMGHFSYVGDADVGARTNIGAGAITCNFTMDGKKHKTTIGEESFIGSDSMLVAPLTIGSRSGTGAGSVVTKDVPDDALAVGVPARVIRRLRQDQ